MPVNNRILITAEQLKSLAGRDACITVDCRFDLNDPGKGRRDWLAGHIPGSGYAHLDDDLSSPILPHTGRHPLPDTDRFAGFLSSIGWTEDRLLVACDEGSGAIAARLWWLMRYYGKPAAILDGGLAAWKAAGYALESGETRIEPASRPNLEADPSMTLETGPLSEQVDEVTIIDARTSDRFRGDSEPLDTVAGRIPGALNRPFGANLVMNGRFKDPETLKQEFSDLLEGTELETVIHSCGSGVTACHNLFAMELAGLEGSRLYPGSWSEWIRDPDRPIATGP